MVGDVQGEHGRRAEGERFEEGIVTRWYKKPGEAIQANEVLLDVETDKISTEVPAPVSGIVAEILVEEGTAARVGQRLGVLRENGAPRPD